MLKTLGFTNAGVVALMVAESVVLCISAAALGLLADGAAVPPHQGHQHAHDAAGEGDRCRARALAVILAVVAALPPALNAGRLKIVDALARR